MYEIERVTLIEIIIFTLIAVTALQKRQLKTLTHNAVSLELKSITSK